MAEVVGGSKRVDGPRENGGAAVVPMDVVEEQGGFGEEETVQARKSRRAASQTAAAKNRAASRAEERADLRNGRGSKRRRASKNVAPEAAPNAALFVGYVEDGETIEMIMKKFETLEKIKEQQQQQPPSNDSDELQGAEQGDATTNNSGGALDEDTLTKVFQETSAFSLSTATRNAESDDFVMEEDDLWDYGDIMAAEDEQGDTLFYIGDGTDDDDLWDELFGKKKKKKRSSGSGSRRAKSADAAGVTQIAFVSDMHNHYITGLKKIRKVDPNAIVYQKIPKNIPLSWAKRITPYRPPDAVHSHTMWRPGAITAIEDDFEMKKEQPVFSLDVPVDNILSSEWIEKVSERAPFEGIVLSPPWKSARLPLQSETEVNQDKSANNFSNGIEPEDLLTLDLGRTGLMASGFVYVWTPKHLILRVLRTLEKMDFHYVENAVYVKKHVSNTRWREPSRYFCQSKETLLICRRGKKHPVSGKIAWSKVEIRHQRSPDIYFDFVRRDENGAHLMPHKYVYNMAETMLPLGRHNPLPALEEEKQEAEKPKAEKPEVEECKGKLVHLWADPQMKRTGWVSVFQK